MWLTLKGPKKGKQLNLQTAYIRDAATYNESARPSQ